MLQELIGLKVLEIEVVFEEQLQVLFEDRICLSVYNKCRLTISETTLENKQILANTFLSKVSENDQNITLLFSNGIELSIDMSEEAYQGPEAMTLHRPGQPIVVW
jgi:hypothetical protein